MTFREYIDAVTTTSDANPSWRLGQAYFNVLMETNFALAEEIRGSDLDPFHRDDVLPSFIVWLQLVWTHPTPPTKNG